MGVNEITRASRCLDGRSGGTRKTQDKKSNRMGEEEETQEKEGDTSIGDLAYLKSDALTGTDNCVRMSRVEIECEATRNAATPQ